MKHNAFLILSEEMKLVHEINRQKLLTTFDGKVRPFYKIEVPAIQRMPPVTLGIADQLFIVELRCADSKRIISCSGMRYRNGRLSERL